ncbi:MAG: preprotein translocase subunit SecY [Gammaproteobacteria bacterium GWE2_42_36]|nr:MAG: preprotein translocase subunit SecY [Gammaproteobacteria bacterium GWE2_42_36]HCU05590.1 preprotein translocase subunit SecY [Coxiellaceae bacterium]
MAKNASKNNTSLSQGGLSELKRRIIFLLLVLFIYRVGAHVPVPGLNPTALANLFNAQQNGILGLFNMFSGGALGRFTVFALGIMPYISASIILQLFSVVSPKLAELKKEGESGQRKINEYTRYATLLLSCFQAVGISKMLAAGGIALNPGISFYMISTLTLVTGSMFLMWLGEQATEKGIGNGISMIIFAGIVAGLPGAIARTLNQVRQGQMQVITVLLIIAFILAITAFVVFVERGLRKITVHYAARQQANRMYAAQKSSLPLKINMAGVIPPIFASSILLFPASLAQWFGQGKGMGWLNQVGLALQQGPLHIIIFTAAIIFFCFFYTALVFNPKDTADNLRKSGAFIPGIRPGEQTAGYIDTVMTRLTFFGALYITIVCLLPLFLISSWNVPFYFGGTSLLIIVVVVMDLMAQINAHLLSHQYESLLKKANLKGGMSLLK